jgi:hypothetical protein
VRAAFTGNTQVMLRMPFTEYLQSSNYEMQFGASITPMSVLKEEELYKGKLPTDDRGIVIDKLLVDKMFKSRVVQEVGIIKTSDLIGRKIKVKNLGEFTITGISNLNSPSAFFADSYCQDVLMYSQSTSTLDAPSSMPIENANEGSNQDSDNPITDYAYAPSSIKIKKGKAPANDYEVVVRDTHEEDMPLNKEIAANVNNHKLKVVGYYTTDSQDDDAYYTTNHTILLGYISKQRVVSVYSDEPGALADKLTEQGYSVQINYDRDKEKYELSEAQNIRSTFTAAGIIILVALIELFLMLRSSFLSRIKEVGTMRAIGLKKRDIYKMFIGEIAVITTITAIPGIAATYYVLSHTTALLGSKFYIAPWVAVLSFLVLMLFNLIVGLMPVFQTMRKTPAAILARVDI